jgi:hypothetical protein
MTIESHDSARAAYEHARDDFGDRLVAAAARRGRRPLPRRAVGLGCATVAAAAAILAVGVPRPGNAPVPLIGGAADAVAAAQQLSRVLGEGVLVRRVETTTYGGDQAGVSIVEDWTDLSTRDQHLRGRGRFGVFEFWNPSAHARWTAEPAYRARDGRQVVTYEYDEGGGNMSASASPAEEVRALLVSARRGNVRARQVTRDGERTMLLERQSTGCQQSPGGGMIQCPELPRGDAPDRDPNSDLQDVTQFERWWVKTGQNPRLVAYDNGVIPLDGEGARVRRVYVSSKYPVWDVLPATEKNLALVRPPAFPADEYFVIKGRTATLSAAIKRGELVCAATGKPPTKKDYPPETPHC